MSISGSWLICIHRSRQKSKTNDLLSLTTLLRKRARRRCYC
uniref:Uncharacterized protein n=1 Tax=Anguilla anguilla TaxID=7936 RepID=A0A0E9R403_ANGAN